MKSLSIMGLSLTLLAFSDVEPVFAEVAEDSIYQEWVQYRNGEISVTFDQIPVEVALNAIHVKTGVQVILPSATESKSLNLRLNRLPLEPAMRSLITSIGFKNFALLYDEKGRPNRAVVLRTQLNDLASLRTDSNARSQSAETAPPPLTVEEQGKLHNELERWSELKQEDRGRLEDRLKSLPPSGEREELLKEYGRRILGIQK
jgi:hypothetical protein